MAALSCLAACCTAATAQNFSLDVADTDPLGLGAFVPDLQGVDLGFEDGIKGAFAYGLRTAVQYNSNLFLAETNREDDFSLNFRPTIAYTSDPTGGAAAVFTASYRPTFHFYADNSDLNEIDNAANAALTFEGSRTLVALFSRYAEVSGSDRLSGNFVDGRVYTGGIRVRRQIASRTSLHGSWTASFSDYSGSTNQGADIYTTTFGGAWQATERFSVGSTLRYTTSDSDNTGSYDTWALLLDARYKAGERIFLSASLGPELQTDTGRTGDDTSVRLAANIAARYVIDDRWSLRTSLRSSTVPAPADVDYVVNDYRFTTEVQRRLVYGFLRGGFELSYSDYDQVGNVAISRDYETNLSFFLGYSRPLFSDRVGLDTMLRYTDNRGDRDWEQWLLTAAVNVVF